MQMLMLVKEEESQMLTHGIIQKSQSKWWSPIVIVLKENGTLELCKDFHKISEITKFNAYPMPRV